MTRTQRGARGLAEPSLWEIVMLLRNTRRRTGLLVGVGAVLAVGSGAAYAGGLASVIGNDGVIHGCYVKNLGTLRVVPTGARCSFLEQPVSWNQTGPPGPKGDVGAAGATGPQGDTGATGPQGLTMTLSR